MGDPFVYFDFFFVNDRFATQAGGLFIRPMLASATFRYGLYDNDGIMRRPIEPGRAYRSCNFVKNLTSNQQNCVVNNGYLFSLPAKWVCE
jgi:hypothetical protein